MEKRLYSHFKILIVCAQIRFLQFFLHQEYNVDGTVLF